MWVLWVAFWTVVAIIAVGVVFAVAVLLWIVAELRREQKEMER